MPLADKRRPTVAKNSGVQVLQRGGGGGHRARDRVGAELHARQGHRAPRPEAGEHPVRVQRPPVPDQDLRLRLGFGHPLPVQRLEPIGHASTAHAGRQRRIHGPRSRRSVHRRARLRRVRQALRLVVAGRYYVHPTLRLPAVLRQMRPGLRLGARGQLLGLPGLALPQHPGGSVRFPGRGVGPHLRRSQVADFGAAAEASQFASERRRSLAPPLAASRQRLFQSAVAGGD